MSNTIYTIPVPPNGAWAVPITRTPRFNTIRQDTAAYRGQTRISLSPYPVWDVEIDTAYFTGSESTISSSYQLALGLFGQMKGSADDFLVTMPGDNTISTAMPFGFGDGVTTAFQITRTFAGFLDIIQNLNGSPSIFVNGVLQAANTYGISNTGIVTFSSPPGVAVPLTWTGSFYYRLHFVDDSLQLQFIGNNVFTASTLKFESVILP